MINIFLYSHAFLTHGCSESMFALHSKNNSKDSSKTYSLSTIWKIYQVLSHYLTLFLQRSCAINITVLVSYRWKKKKNWGSFSEKLDDLPRATQMCTWQRKIPFQVFQPQIHLPFPKGKWCYGIHASHRAWIKGIGRPSIGKIGRGGSSFVFNQCSTGLELFWEKKQDVTGT